MLKNPILLVEYKTTSFFLSELHKKAFLEPCDIFACWPIVNEACTNLPDCMKQSMYCKRASSQRAMEPFLPIFIFVLLIERFRVERVKGEGGL